MFGSMMGGFDMGMGFDDDDMFGNPFRQMNNMMNSMLANPFGGMFGQNMLMDPSQQQRRGHHRNNDMMMPFGGMFGGMQQLMSQMNTDPNCHSFSSSSVMTMTSGPDGRPQVYQASSSTRQGPGGVKETKKTLCDSRKGIKKMQIGHHIGERAHVIEREQDLNSGQQEENQEFINLEEDEADSFNHEWMQKTQRYSRRGQHDAIGYGSPRHHRHSNGPQLALPSSTSHRYGRDY
ncbi:myeloid leukemia factor isoform X2 [Bemisia tabaci]|uniref:myeloid leukemia factor isoform X2 n=1 Tax=Bemisia tabaci TaxID=7038 RepID=UPI0008F9A741|nr:PREDICTED: myeloid leukemia factor isoform X2 [Bemisia tabaci]